MIEMIDVYKSFGKNDGRVEALRGLSLSISKGEMVAIMGKSGSGKSTLLNIIGGLMSFDDGQYIYNGAQLSKQGAKELTAFRRDEIGFVVQYFALVDDLDVYHNIALPLQYKGYGHKKIKNLVMESMKELGIEDKKKAYPTELSGGQKQRVAIARAIVKQPRIILADEPTGALDEATSEEVQKIFRKLNESGKTVIIVTHDKKVAEKCDRIIYIKDGRVEENAE